MQEWKRKLGHALAVLTILPIIYLPEAKLAPIFAFLAAGALVLHWFIDHRELRRKKFDLALEGIFEALGDKYDRKKGKELEKMEEEFYKAAKAQVLRAEEKSLMMPSVYFFSSLLFALAFFDKEVLVFGIIALTLGDTSAALIGKHFGKNKIFWNKGKSWQGFAAFSAATFAASYVFAFFFPQLVLFNPLKLSLLAGLVGAFVESLPIVDDNFTIPLFTGLAIYLASFWL